jgi:ribosomal-protein-alanine N-acetyltransferase
MAIQFETPVLHTERLILRPIEQHDVPTVQREFGRWNIIKNMTKKCPWPYPKDGAMHWFTHSVLPGYATKSGALWAIAKRSMPEALIGVIDVREDIGDGHRGFWMAESEQGNGYMTEAVTAVNDWVFTHTPLTELVVFNVASNTASRRVKEKTGAVYVRTVIEDYHCGETESEVWRTPKEAWISRHTDD